MIWPGTLMSTAMFTTLHGEENKPADGWKISRWRFFVSTLFATLRFEGVLFFFFFFLEKPFLWGCTPGESAICHETGEPRWSEVRTIFGDRAVIRSFDTLDI
jgi:hypothetical protein